MAAGQCGAKGGLHKEDLGMWTLMGEREGAWGAEKKSEVPWRGVGQWERTVSGATGRRWRRWAGWRWCGFEGRRLGEVRG